MSEPKRRLYPDCPQDARDCVPCPNHTEEGSCCWSHCDGCLGECPKPDAEGIR